MTQKSGHVHPYLPCVYKDAPSRETGPSQREKIKELFNINDSNKNKIQSPMVPTPWKKKKKKLRRKKN